MKYVVLNTFISIRYSILSPRKFRKTGDSLDGFSRNHEKRSSSSPDRFFLRRAREPVALSPLGVHQRNFDCQPGHPAGTEVFIGTTSGRGLRLQARVTSAGACPSCRTGKSPNLRISSLRRNVVESVLFSDSTVRL